MAYYDVVLKVFIGEYEKSCTNRVNAESEKEAIYQGFIAEVHNLGEIEVRDILDLTPDGSHEYELDDCEFTYLFDELIPLKKVAVVVDGVDAIALLPDTTSNQSKHYYVKD